MNHFSFFEWQIYITYLRKGRNKIILAAEAGRCEQDAASLESFRRSYIHPWHNVLTHTGETGETQLVVVLGVHHLPVCLCGDSYSSAIFC